MVYLIFGVLGLVIGSFANVCIVRLPKDQSIRTPGSSCPHCHHPLTPFLNIPILSFIFLRGRCLYCKASISWQYPTIEGLMAVLFLFHTWLFYPSIERIIVANVLGFFLFTLSLIDYRHRIIPDELSVSLLFIGLTGSFLNPYLEGLPVMKFLQSLTACLAGGALMLLIAWAGEKAFKKEAIGGGDIKLIAAIGAVLGWQGVMGPLLIGSLAGGGAAITLLILKKKKLGETLPFGPFLSFGAYIACLYPRLLPLLLSTEMRTLNFP
jgi:leader peptidase (prepilin peptidase)/N-methyltransferase